MSSSGAIEVRSDVIAEIVSDSGEGAQKAGQIFGAVCAKDGNGVWTVEIIPAEIKPPARSPAGASGIRIRFGDHAITNMGDHADLVMAFNEQVLYGRIAQKAYQPGTRILLESRWANDPQPNIRAQYAKALGEFKDAGFEVIELPIDEACAASTKGSRVGKNMFVLGMLCRIFGKEVERAYGEIELVFGRKGPKVVESNRNLAHAGYAFAAAHVPFLFTVAPRKDIGPQVVMNGNQAFGLGVMASGMEMVAMYPITPATSASHYLADAYPATGGFVHQAEDEIAAIGFAVGASYAGKTACTITSGPGLALKTEFIGLAVMAEIPLVIGVVQRGGPSTGLPTKVEQGDLLAAIFGAPGDSPKVVVAASTIEDCFYLPITCRRIAETFRTPVLILSDTNLATGVAPFPRPQPVAEWLAPPIDRAPWDTTVEPYAWDDETGTSTRPIPGQANGMYVLTGLAHTRRSKVAYDPDSNQLGCEARSRKLAALARTLVPPKPYGADEGDLLVVGWGSTLGTLHEAVDRARAEGLRVSALHLRFLSPMEPGLKAIFARFKNVMTVEINYSDPEGAPLGTAPRRLAQLAMLLRAETLVDVDCWSRVPGQPLPPHVVYEVIVERLARGARARVPTHPAASPQA